MAFNFFDYCNDPAYPSTLEVWLTTSPLPRDGGIALADVAEASFKGYRRAKGDDIWFERLTEAGYKFRLTSKSLTWVSQDPLPVTLTGCLLVANTSGVFSLVDWLAFSSPFAISSESSGVTVFVRENGAKIVP